MRDELKPLKPWSKEYGILNLDISANNGTHWTMWYKNGNKSYYFDSFGENPPNELIKYLKCENILVSLFQVQDFGTNYCGHLCLIVLNHLIRNEKFENIILDINECFTKYHSK